MPSTCLWLWKWCTWRRTNNPPSHLHALGHRSPTPHTVLPAPRVYPILTSQPGLGSPPPLFPSFFFPGVISVKSLQQWYNYSSETRGRAAGQSVVCVTVCLNKLKPFGSHLLEINLAVVLSTVAGTPARQRSFGHPAAWHFLVDMPEHINRIFLWKKKRYSKKRCEKP